MRRLFVYGARVGDLVLLTPLMRHLAFSARLDLLARPWAPPLLQNESYLESIHPLAHPNATRIKDWVTGAKRHQLGKSLRQRGYDEIVMFRGESPNLRGWIDDWAPTIPRREITFKSGGEGCHRTEAGRKALEAAGYPVEDYDPMPRLEVSSEALITSRALLDPLGQRVIAVQAGSSLTHRWLRRKPNLKGLTPVQWGRWIGHLLADDEADAVILLGSAPEGKEARAIRAQVPVAQQEQVHDWTGQVDLARLPATLAACHAVLSVDTGPAHIAAAVGCPLLVLFGPTDPAVFAPRGPGAIVILEGSSHCRPCHGTATMSGCRDNQCLTSITEFMLMNAFAQLMSSMSVQSCGS